MSQRTWANICGNYYCFITAVAGDDANDVPVASASAALASSSDDEDDDVSYAAAAMAAAPDDEDDSDFNEIEFSRKFNDIDPTDSLHMLVLFFLITIPFLTVAKRHLTKKRFLAWRRGEGMQIQFII